MERDKRREEQEDRDEQERSSWILRALGIDDEGEEDNLPWEEE